MSAGLDHPVLGKQLLPKQEFLFAKERKTHPSVQSQSNRDDVSNDGIVDSEIQENCNSMSFPSPEYSQSTNNDSTQSTNTYTDVDEDTDSDMLQLLDSIPFDAILSAMMDETETEDDRLLSNRGYFILNEVTPTLQGTLFKAKQFSLSA